MTQATFIKDSQSRITNYGIKCFQLIDGIKCHAFAYAKKKGNILIVSDCYSYCIDENDNTLNGSYKIIEIGTGKIANIKSIKF